MGNCCGKETNKQTGVDFNDIKVEEKQKRKNSYSKDPTNLPSPGQTTDQDTSTAGKFYR